MNVHVPAVGLGLLDVQNDLSRSVIWVESRGIGKKVSLLTILYK